MAIHRLGNKLIIPRIKIIEPETFAQKEASTPTSKLLNLINKLNVNTENPSDADTISALFLGFWLSFKLPPTTMGSIGKAHGAKTVKAPEIKLNKKINIILIDL